MDATLVLKFLAYFRFLLLGGLAFIILRRFSPQLAKAVLWLAVGVNGVWIVLDFIT